MTVATVGEISRSAAAALQPAAVPFVFDLIEVSGLRMRTGICIHCSSSLSSKLSTKGSTHTSMLTTDQQSRLHRSFFLRRFPPS